MGSSYLPGLCGILPCRIRSKGGGGGADQDDVELIVNLTGKQPERLRSDAEFTTYFRDTVDQAEELTGESALVSSSASRLALSLSPGL